ncbi:MAG: HEAT repeat domain-containing protein [Methanosarcinales archaeon]|nr:HEAT repeat domain-containing protein [Methanosarcinales archaeon]
MPIKVKKPMEPKNPEKSGKSDKEKIAKLTCDLKKYDDVGYLREREAELDAIVDGLASIGSPAVPELIRMLSDPDNWSSSFAADALGKIGDESAIIPLADVLEDSDLGKHAKDALKEFGHVCIPEVIKRVEYRIAHPIRGEKGIDRITSDALNAIGEIRCDESIKFLNRLLDEYMSELPDGPFDPTKHDWKYVNVDFFHLLDCMVRQQDERAIPHIEKARDVFPSNYVDYKICQIAIGRIKKKRPDEGYLPLESLDILLPAGAIMNALSGGELGWKDTFEEEYGEYFEEVGGWDRGGDESEDRDDDDNNDHEYHEDDDMAGKRKFDQVYQFKITLKRIRPPIWRRIQVPETYTFHDLHVAIQDVMGWEGYHLHEFEMADPVTGLEMRIGVPSEDFGFSEVLQEQKEPISGYFSMENQSAEYTYDFGDDWGHRILLEKILPRDGDTKYPVCIKGKRACPPEDCGGVWGYEELLEALHDPDSAEDEELLEWLGEGFDPEYFDAKAIYFRKSGR